MTPKEKALKLHIKFYDAIPTLPDEGQMEYEAAKQCALIAVDEMLEETKECADKEIVILRIIFWEKVKQEIEKL